jgi:aspartyl-tRNA(Asn)/glutamyl-tRNA(Gln) amidotransferase subunit C
MKLNRDDVLYVARLAKLTLSEEETDRLASQMGQILTYVEQLNQLRTEGIEPTSHAIQLENVFRDDRNTPSLSPERALENAPGRENGFFKVPKVIE